jgi:hypothetical protein
MFCPKCGTSGNEAQKFCKACGTNLQLVSDALGKGGDLFGQVVSIDMESLNKKVAEFARNLKPEWENFWKTNVTDNFGGTAKIDPYAHGGHRPPEPPHKQLPKNWLSYSWQHSVKQGIVSLLAGAGTAAVFYYFGRAVINSGAINDLEALARVSGLGQIVSLLWLLGVVPALKGIGQLFYAAFFAPSIFKLAQQLMPPAPPPLEMPQQQSYSAVNEAPGSVTEHTTQFFGEGKSRVGAHKQSI